MDRERGEFLNSIGFELDNQFLLRYTETMVQTDHKLFSISSILLFVCPLVSCISSKAMSSILFQENFENTPVGAPYPWNGSNSDEWYDDNYNRAVVISETSPHYRPYLGNRVLYLDNSESRHYIPSQANPIKVQYDLLFHKSPESEWGSAFGNGISMVEVTGNPRYATYFSIRKDYLSMEDGIYFKEMNGVSKNICDIEEDVWYNITRIINPSNQTETIKIINRDNSAVYNFSADLQWSVISIEGFTFTSHYLPSYKLVDNLKIEVIPEPCSLTLLGLGSLFLMIKKKRCIR